MTGAPDIRFYAGAPLITPDKFRLGTLCVIDTKPHDGLSEEAENILTLLARLVVNAMETRRTAVRLQHQTRMVTQLAENSVALSQMRKLSDAGKFLADSARALAVADTVYVRLGDTEFVANRDGKTQASTAIPWQERGEALIARRSFAPTTTKDLRHLQNGADKGAWMGFLLGFDQDKPIGHLQIWRQYTTSFTDLEKAMLTDLVRVASAVAEKYVAK